MLLPSWALGRTKGNVVRAYDKVPQKVSTVRYRLASSQEKHVEETQAEIFPEDQRKGHTI